MGIMTRRQQLQAQCKQVPISGSLTYISFPGAKMLQMLIASASRARSKVRLPRQHFILAHAVSLENTMHLPDDQGERNKK